MGGFSALSRQPSFVRDPGLTLQRTGPIVDYVNFCVPSKDIHAQSPPFNALHGCSEYSRTNTVSGQMAGTIRVEIDQVRYARGAGLGPNSEQIWQRGEPESSELLNGEHIEDGPARTAGDAERRRRQLATSPADARPEPGVERDDGLVPPRLSSRALTSRSLSPPCRVAAIRSTIRA